MGAWLHAELKGQRAIVEREIEQAFPLRPGPPGEFKLGDIALLFPRPAIPDEAPRVIDPAGVKIQPAASSRGHVGHVERAGSEGPSRMHRRCIRDKAHTEPGAFLALLPRHVRDLGLGGFRQPVKIGSGRAPPLALDPECRDALPLHFLRSGLARMEGADA